MPTDATGTPTTNLGIPKYDTSVDAPSGLGFNATMDFIDSILHPAGLASGETLVWNGTAFVRSSVTRIGAASLGSGSPDGTKVLRGDGVWVSRGMELIADTGILGVATGSIDFPSIPQTFKHLLLVASLRDTGAAPVISPIIRFNGDGGTNYDVWEIVATGSTIAAGGGAGLSTATANLTYPGSTADASKYGVMTFNIINYTGGGYKSYNYEGGAYASGGVNAQRYVVGAGIWKGVGGAAINDIKIFAGSTALDAGSRATLYGLG